MIKQLTVIKTNIEYIIKSTSVNDTLRENFLEIRCAVNELNDHFIDDGK